MASLGGLLFGFDTAVIAGTTERVKGQFGLDEFMQGWFASSALVGCVFGAASAGALGDRFGRRPMLQLAALLFFVSALFSAVPEDFGVLIAARVVGGLGVGVASVLAPMYISELAPRHLRGRLVAFYQLSIVLGILAAYFSNLALLSISERSAGAPPGLGFLRWVLVDEVWRGMFGVEMVPAGLFFLLLFFVPESPRFLILSGRRAEGHAVLERIGGSEAAGRNVAEIEASAAAEAEGGAGVAELFRPGLRTALMVGVGLAVFGPLTGVNSVTYYGPKILMEAGFEEFGAFLGQVGFGFILLVATIAALLLIDRLGRRPLLVSGMVVVALMLFAVGALFAIGTSGGGGAVPQGYGLLIGAALCVYMASIGFSISAVIWVLTPEIFPNRVRGRAASIATPCNWGTNLVAVFAFPALVGAFGIHNSFFVFAGITCLGTLFFWRFVPETKGKSLEEIEGLWKR